jgi:ribosomal protein S12 methylthiotransferase
MTESARENPRPDSTGRRRSPAVSLPILGESRPAARRRIRRTPPAGKPPVVGFISLGCAKNLVDSEKMLGQIAESGAIISADELAADTMLVNTCGFLGAARDEAMAVIAELAERKRRGQLKRIVVAGCLVQRDAEKIREQIPEVDALVGVHNRDDVQQAVWGRAAEPKKGTRGPDLFLGEYHAQSRSDTGRLRRGSAGASPSPHAQTWSDRGRLRLTPQHYTYVRISEGCDQKCTFCTIPAIRGPMHSKPPAELIAECRELITDGARELILIGQDTTSYGGDIGYKPGLAGLLRTLDAACEGARWIRLMYVYPTLLTDEVLDAIAECNRVLPYIDIPLQHINDRVLKAMGRRITRAKTEALLERIRRRIPGVTIRSTFIVGFPGETEAEFGELLEFVRGFGFDAAGAFKFSLEAETPAARLKGRFGEAVKEERFKRFMLTQQEVALAAARRKIGQSLYLAVDGPDEAGRGHAARHAGQAPEVDSVTLLRTGDFAPGQLLAARCIGTDGYDLVARPVRPRR